MSNSNVLTIQAYRDRRSHRLRLAESLYRASASRSALLEHCAEAARLTGADRAAVVWVDEYGPGLVHPHVVLDLLADRPRRSFGTESLRRAWELGVPGALDEPAAAGPGGSSSLSVALGSDGTRAWFLVAQSVSVRPSLDEETREQIMFLAGECSAVVLHRDLDALLDPADETETARSRFAGWPVLRDMEGRDADDDESKRISRRFMVARLVRMLVDDDLILPLERIEEQARQARAELHPLDPETDREAGVWHRVLDAFECSRMDDLSVELVRMGEVADDAGHRHGARELYQLAYDVAVAAGEAHTAIEAARFHARLLRRQAEWEEATEWYRTAKAIAEHAELHDRVARVMGGLALIDKDRGNLPAARAGLLDALPTAARSGDANTLGSIYHDLMAVEQMLGDSVTALEYGWLGVTTYADDRQKVRCLATLAGVLELVGEHGAAEDAWLIVAHRADDEYSQVYAWDALGHLAALRGDGAAFDRRSARCDAFGWQDGQPSAAAEILYYRGLSCHALGRCEDAEAWLLRAIEFGEARGFGRTVIKAEEALEAIRADVPAEGPDGATVETPEELRLGLREMRLELVGTG